MPKQHINRHLGPFAHVGGHVAVLLSLLVEVS